MHDMHGGYGTCTTAHTLRPSSIAQITTWKPISFQQIVHNMHLHCYSDSHLPFQPFPHKVHGVRPGAFVSLVAGQHEGHAMLLDGRL